MDILFTTHFPIIPRTSDLRLWTLNWDLDLGLTIPDKSASIGFEFIGNSRNSITQIQISPQRCTFFLRIVFTN